MQQGKWFLKISILCVLSVGVISEAGLLFADAQSITVPDAQIEANVLKALAGSSQLANQTITSTTVYGTVTLSGAVRDETSRDLADKLVSNTAGVRKVVDQMTIGPAVAPAGPVQAQESAEDDTNPNLQSDGTMAPTPGAASQGQGTSGAEVQSPIARPQPQSAGTQSQRQYPPGYEQHGPTTENASPYGPPTPPSPSSPGSPRQPVTPQYGQPQRPYVTQKGGDAVIVPSGSLVRVRINQGMDSKHTPVGTTFDGVVLNDVVAGGSVAIPRGATIQGTVVEAKKAGDFGGKGELKLQLTHLELGGKVYPIVTDFWWHQGADKTGNTVGNTVGLGAMGALVGAVAGGGVGALVGAGIGGVAGLGVSASTDRGEAALPSEAIVTFHLTQPTDVTTVSQAELNRLGAGVPAGAQPQMRRRYPYGYPPPPPPYYYGPGYYPPPY